MKFTDEQVQKMDFSTANAELSNSVYEACGLLEQLERLGKIRGNGHHARQAVATIAEKELEKRWIDAVN